MFSLLKGLPSYWGKWAGREFKLFRKKNGTSFCVHTVKFEQDPIRDTFGTQGS